MTLIHRCLPSATPPTSRRSRAALLLLAFAAVWLSSGCAHNVLIRTVPEGAEVTVDGVEEGPSPVVVQRGPGPFGDMTVEASLESFSSTRRVVARDQLFLWPVMCGLVPLLGIATLAIPFPVGPALCVGWGVATSPSLCALAFTRRFPDEVILELKPRLEPHSGELLPTDGWTIPEEYAPNPVPLPAPLPEDEEEANNDAPPQDSDVLPPPEAFTPTPPQGPQRY